MVVARQKTSRRPLDHSSLSRGMALSVPLSEALAFGTRINGVPLKRRVSKRHSGKPKKSTDHAMPKSGPRQSKLEQKVALQLRAAGLPDPEVEYRFHPVRKWRFDFCWPERLLALEVEGGVFCPTGSRHTSPVGFHNDCTKYNEAALLGYSVLRVTTQHIQEGVVIDLVQRALLLGRDAPCSPLDD
jgi:very-short-patch-repair endonuclease